MSHLVKSSGVQLTLQWKLTYFLKVYLIRKKQEKIENHFQTE